MGLIEFSERWVPAGEHLLFTRFSMGSLWDERPAIVLVHGLGVSTRYFMPLANKLARHYRVLAPDLPGFGHSTKPPYIMNLPEHAHVLVDWMSAMDLERAVFLGNSLGCQVVMELAIRHRQRIERGILVSPTIAPSIRTAPQLAMRWLLELPREITHGHLLMRDYYDAGPRRFLRTFQYALRDEVEQKLDQIETPMLIIRGERDPLVPQKWVERMARELPQADLVVVSGKGHTVHFTAHDRVAALVREYLAHEVEPQDRKEMTHESAFI
jgi:pimeloyl-ACP methyl ester carboxylesterase